MLQAKKKIEIVLGQTFVPRILDFITQLNIGGYTLIKNVIGLGDHGEQDCQELVDVHSNSYFIIVTTQEKAEAFIQQVRPLMEKIGGMLLISDVQLVKY